MVKRSLDIVIGTLLLLFTLPIFLVVGAMVFFRLGRPIIWSQVRPGLAGRPFVLYKFRTMTESVDAKGQLLPDAVRMTRLGQTLRRASLDELPQLLNVLRGDLSLVGPRPLLIEYLPLYSLDEMRRHDVRPGLTGWAQVNGRNAIGWEERFAMDVWYVDNQSLMLDMRILWRTLRSVFMPSGIAPAGETTMPKLTRRPL